jgi:hypothetical protein
LITLGLVRKTIISENGKVDKTMIPRTLGLCKTIVCKGTSTNTATRLVAMQRSKPHTVHLPHLGATLTTTVVAAEIGTVEIFDCGSAT